VHLVKKLGYTSLEVHRNDQIDLEDVNRFDKIILSPGPGIPSEAGLLLPLIKRYASTKCILGVCLGHQAIGEAFGANLINMSTVLHGVSSPIHIKKDNELLFSGIPDVFEAGRYHSWAIDRKIFPDCFDITAEDEAGEIMAITHKQFNVRGVQFHPESVLTPMGEKMILNWLKS
jgi:anthranilate synthase component 2